MRICIISPAFIHKNNKYINVPMQHLGISYIASMLEFNNFNVEIIDSVQENLTTSKLNEKIEKEKYDAIGISTYFYNYMQVALLVKRIRKKNKNIFIFLGGYFPTFEYERILFDLLEVDCCVIGEGEITTLELMKNLDNRQAWKDVLGIAYLENGKICFTGRRHLIENLDELPFPKRKVFSREVPSPVLTSRGCYGRCNYCSAYGFYNTCIGNRVRRRTPENVVDEIEKLINNYNVDHIHINDDSFTIASKNSRKWFYKFYELIKQKNINVKFACDFRADEIVSARDIIEDFMQIGLYNVFVGIESLEQEQLDFYNKGLNVEHNIKAIEIIKELGLEFRIGVLLFDPIVTVDRIYKSLKIVDEIKLYEYGYMLNPISSYNPAIANIGTPLYDYVKAHGLYYKSNHNYHFKHDKTQLFYEILVDIEWSEEIRQLINRKYLFSAFQKTGANEKMNMIKIIFNDLFEIDLQYILEVCKEIINGSINQPSDAYALKVSSIARLKEIKNRLDQMEKEFNLSIK